MSYPGRDLERSTLWRANQLTPDEMAALEREWRREFDAAQAPDFSLHDGVEVLYGDRARRAHYRWADIPDKLIKRWEKAELRRRRSKTIRDPRKEGDATWTPEPGNPSG
jgi:hypothetical protein